MSWEAGAMIPPPNSFNEVDFYMTWRVGLLIPSPHSVMEVDFYRSLPHDTTLHTARMYMPDMSTASEEQMLRAPHLSHAALPQPLDETIAAELLRARHLLAERVHHPRSHISHHYDQQIRKDDAEEKRHGISVELRAAGEDHEPDGNRNSGDRCQHRDEG